VADRQRKKLIYKRMESTEPISVCDMQTIETILAKMVARTFVADHSELFDPHSDEKNKEVVDENE